ncbi:isoleucine--tRNA ligase [Candidatus Woesearchaeota archaeon]|nr:isoleucine--tRNA ligase [Candidatus Woesearchaeota archaeon]
MRFPAYNFKELEPQLVEFWKNNKVLEKLEKKNAKGKKFYFLDGPPYTSGKFHLGHAWNYALKDIGLRYKRSRGFKVWNRNGFDVHGLPTEHKVMDKYKLITKEDIQKFGLAKFIKECQKFCLEMAEVMTTDLERMGITVRQKNPYMALHTEFMEGEWALIKKAYETKRLYYGEKVLTWCQHCETAVAKHECEYETVKDKSIFVKFPLKGKSGEYLIVWTTTPWTIPFNLAVMVGPEIDYVKVEVEGEKWILAKALAGVVVQAVIGKSMKVLEEFKGKTLEGLEYTHPFAELLPQYAQLKKEHPHVHTIILSDEFVDTTAGTGLVHAAPGCGPEDQEACKPYDIPPFNTLTENGYFPKEMGTFSGLRAKVNDDSFTAALKKVGALLATTDVEHEYPHCWRCHKPVVFRITFQWFFKVEDLRQAILDGNKRVHWVPDTANHAYESWIRNLKDNSISRQRYWGTPLPIWKCAKCGTVKVIGSRKEIEDAGGKVPRNLHVPWIDKVKLSCSCGSVMKRVPDVIDVWVDAGTTSWNCLDNDPQLLQELYPADFIMEAKEQTRLWFSMLSICSYIYRHENAFRNVYVYGMLNDLDGRKMSKSLGNIISPYELIDKHGVDVLRYYMCQNNAGQDINFSWDECGTKARYLHILWNIHILLINLAKENKCNPFKLKTGKKQRGVEERYIFSKLHSTIRIVTARFESYQLDQAIAPLEELCLELSRTYIQMIRDKSSIGSERDKEVCMATIAEVLLDSLKMFSIVCPFVAEAIYQNLREEFKLKQLSISHFSWPDCHDEYVDATLEQHLQHAHGIIRAALNAREKAKLSLRWPVKEIVIMSRDEGIADTVAALRNVLGTQTNAKEIRVVDHLPELEVQLEPNPGALGSAYGKLTPEIMAHLASTNAEDVQKKMLQENKYSFELHGNEVKISEEMVTFMHTVPENYQESAFSQGFVYVNLERTEELESEGYAREIMRHLQSLRKKAGLEKSDRITVFLRVPEKMQMEKFSEDIQEKVGALSLDISATNPSKDYTTADAFSVKGKDFKVWFEKA